MEKDIIVKIIDVTYDTSFEEAVNKFIRFHNGDIVDIKFSTYTKDNQGHYVAMIMYKW